LRALVTHLIEVLRRHPCAKDVLEQVDQTRVQGFLTVWDRALGLARAAGFDVEQSCLISKYLLQGSIAIAAATSGAHTRGMSPEQAAETFRLKRLGLQSLPADRFPHLVAMAAPMAEGGSRELYGGFGVDLLLCGIEALAARR
jgi:TetR/AcrR family transcriptional regulator, tetracycline repressor protein